MSRRYSARSIRSTDGARRTALLALWGWTLAFHAAGAVTASTLRAQSDCTCAEREGGGRPWWLAFIPAGAAGLLALPGGAAKPAAAAPIEVIESGGAVDLPAPIAVPPVKVAPAPTVAPMGPHSDKRIPVKKDTVAGAKPTAYQGPVPRLRILRRLLGVPESAFAEARVAATEARRVPPPARATVESTVSPTRGPRLASATPALTRLGMVPAPRG